MLQDLWPENAYISMPDIIFMFPPIMFKAKTKTLLKQPMASSVYSIWVGAYASFHFLI